MMKWSKQQQACIEHKDHPIIVSASAGAGKTAVLTERIVKRCLKDKIDLNRILALTFTAAAASEMKDRVYQRLLKAKLDNQSDSHRIDHQLTLLQEAQISTIHSFCLNIIKKYGYLIGFDQQRANRLFSDVALKQLKNEAFNLTLVSLTTDQLNHLTTYFSNKPCTYDSFQQTLTSLLDQANNQCNPIQSIKDIASSYPTIQSLAQLDSATLNKYASIFDHYLPLLKSNLKQIHNGVSENYFTKNKAKMDALTEYLNSIETAVTDKDYEQVENLYRYTYPGNLSIPKDPANLIEKQRLKAFNQLMDNLINSTAPSALINDMNQLHILANDLSNALLAYYTYFNQVKEKANGIDFNDMEYFAFKILDENPSVATYYQNYYQEICVDEFQDTSIRQNAIIEHICNGKNIFRVGDVKQSIYRFRQASPELMKSLMEDNANELIVLEENYRSSASIIDFTNHLFTQLLNIGLPNNQYLNQDIVSPGTQNQKDSYQPIEFYGMDSDAFKALNLTNSNQNKAECIAGLIQQYRNNSPFTHYKDYCILVRSHGAMHYLKETFDQLNIPYKMDLKSGFSGNAFIQTLRAMFALMLDFNDQLALYTVLASPYYLYSVQDLYDHKVNSNAKVIQDYDELKAFIHQCKTFQNKGISALLSQCLCFKSIYQRLTREDRFNVDYLMQSLVTNNITTIPQVLQLLDKSLDQDSSEILSVGKDDDVVTVMTIHQSKGLQFPCVILWSDSSNSNPENKSLINWDNQFNVGLKALYLPTRLTHSSLVYTYNDITNQAQDLAERLRLLYVAITRAKEKLLIVDMLKDVPDVHPYQLSDIYLRKGFTYDILSTCITNNLFQLKRLFQPLTPLTNTLQSMKGYPIIHYHAKPLNLTIRTASEHDILSEDLLKDSHGALEYGTFLHDALQFLDFSQINDEQLQAYNARLTKPMRVQLCKAKDTLLSFGKEKAITSWLKEYPFIYRNESIFTTGSIDLIGLSKSSIYIIDYKTTSDTIDNLKAMYTKQLNYYQSIITKAYPDYKIECYIYSFKHDCMIQI